MATRAEVDAAASRLEGLVRRTPLIEAHGLRRLTGRHVWLKLETLQRTRSFKYRGALNAVLTLTSPGKALPHMVTASAGNHGLALAVAASAAGGSLQVFAPRTAPRSKLDRMSLPGVSVDTASPDYDAAQAAALDAAARGRGLYVSPYNHPAVIAGAGTTGLEILDDLPSPGAIVVPTGGGGLLAGIAIAAGDRTMVAGVEPAANAAFTSSLQTGHITTITPGHSLADALMGNLEAHALTFDLVRRHAACVRVVHEAHIAAGLRSLLAAERIVAEGAGAIGIGALLAGSLNDLPDPVVVVISGANIDTGTFLAAIGA